MGGSAQFIADSLRMGRRKKRRNTKEKPTVRSVVSTGSMGPTKSPNDNQILLGGLPLYYRATLTKLFAANKFELLFAFLIIGATSLNRKVDTALVSLWLRVER